MGLRADSARPQRVGGSARTDSRRAESAHNPIAPHVNFGDDSALNALTRTQWTKAFKAADFRRVIFEARFSRAPSGRRPLDFVEYLLLWISDPVRPRFLAITSSDLARSLSNFRTRHFSPSADFCQYGLLTKNRKLRYLSLLRNVNLIYYPDGGCTRRPAGLDGSAGQPRWGRPSLTPPTGRDPLGS